MPLRELLVDGELDIYPEIAGRGYFDLVYRQGALVLRATRYVGLIPISDRVAIHVRPKVPIGNLLWMVWRSGGSTKTLEGVMRSYGERPGEIDSPEALYLDAFFSGLSKIGRQGPLKRYRTRESDREWRGRLSVARSVGRYYARAVKYRHSFDVTDHTVDIPENRILKHTALRLFAHLGGVGSPPEQLASARRGLEVLTAVDHTAVHPEFVARIVPRLLRAIPTAYSHYEAPLWLAYLIATRSAVLMETMGKARFESVVIDVSEIFESYVRQICVDVQHSILRCQVRDGNKAPVRLYRSGKAIDVRPDVYFVRGNRTLAVADAKYKAVPSREDRYEVLAHCAATSARNAAFICPALPDSPMASHHGTTNQGIRFDLLRIDLSASDMRAEEDRFARAVAAIVDVAEDAIPWEPTHLGSEAPNVY